MPTLVSHSHSCDQERRPDNALGNRGGYATYVNCALSDSSKRIKRRRPCKSLQDSKDRGCKTEPIESGLVKLLFIADLSALGVITAANHSAKLGAAAFFEASNGYGRQQIAHKGVRPVSGVLSNLYIN